MLEEEDEVEDEVVEEEGGGRKMRMITSEVEQKNPHISEQRNQISLFRPPTGVPSEINLSWICIVRSLASSALAVVCRRTLR